MKKTIKKMLSRALAVAVVMSMTCSYAFAASFDDLQNAIDGDFGPVPVETPSEPAGSSTSDDAASSDADASSGTDSDTSIGEDTSSSETPSEAPSDDANTNEDASSDADTDENTSDDANADENTSDDANADEDASDDADTDENTSDDANTDEDASDVNTDAGASSDEENKVVSDETKVVDGAPANEPATSEEVQTPPATTKPPQNGSWVGKVDGTDRFGYGWSQDDAGNWNHGIEAWEDEDGTRNVQLKEDVKNTGKEDNITISGGNKIHLDLNGFNITGNGSGSVVTVGDNYKKPGNLTLDDTSENKTGTITGGNTGVDVWDNGEFTMNGGNISGNEGGGLGGGVVNRGEFTMNGGAISNNSADKKGGGVFVNQVGSFTMNGGTISGNKTNLNEGDYADSGDPIGQGGGVYVNGGGKFNMNGGTISGNEAGEGGGIFIAKGNASDKTANAEFEMNGGTVDGNIAHIGEGGGIYIRGEGEINAGHITNNKTFTKHDLGGGGIYIEVGGKLQLYNAIITDNKAEGLGAGLAACVHGQTIVYVKNGAAIFGNTANGNATTKGHNNNGDLIDGHDEWENDDTFKNAANDVFTASDKNELTGEGAPGVVIGPQMLGGGDAGWTGYLFLYEKDGSLKYDAETGKPMWVPVTKDNNGNIIYANKLLGLKADPSEETIEAAKAAALATTGGGVWITNNYSATHGGGIANNGVLTIGEDVFKSEDPKDPEGTKYLVKDENAPEDTADRDLKDNEFTFVLKDAAGNEIATGTNAAGGDIVIKFPDNYFYNKEPGDYEFFITEVNDHAENIIYDEGTRYRVVVTIAEEKYEGETIGNETVKGTILTATTVIYKEVVNENGETKWVPLEEDESMTFTNKYTSTEVPEEPNEDPETPKTPDDPKDPDEPEEPKVEVPEEDVPLVPGIEEPAEEVEVLDDTVPLVEIPEEDVPLAEAPKTGDISSIWYAMIGLSAAGLALLSMLKKRGRN